MCHAMVVHRSVHWLQPRFCAPQFEAAAAALAAAGHCLWLDPNKTSLSTYNVVRGASGGATIGATDGAAASGNGASNGRGTKRSENGVVKKAVIEARSPVQIAKAVKVRLFRFVWSFLCLTSTPARRCHLLLNQHDPSTIHAIAQTCL